MDLLQWKTLLATSSITLWFSQRDSHSACGESSGPLPTKLHVTLSRKVCQHNWILSSKLANLKLKWRKRPTQPITVCEDFVHIELNILQRMLRYFGRHVPVVHRCERSPIPVIALCDIPKCLPNVPKCYSYKDRCSNFSRPKRLINGWSIPGVYTFALSWFIVHNEIDQPETAAMVYPGSAMLWGTMGASATWGNHELKLVFWQHSKKETWEGNVWNVLSLSNKQ